MGIPVLKLNLAPPPSLWRRNHLSIGWGALALGGTVLALALGITWRAYLQADRMGRAAEGLSREAGLARARQSQLQRELEAIDIQQEAPRWQLAERILIERSNPWSRITAELERSLVQDVRLRAIQRARGSDGRVSVKLKGEARTREAEGAFVQALSRNAFFGPLLLEREAERPGGGIEFEASLPVSREAIPYEPLPKYGPASPKAAPRTIAAPTPKPAAVIPSKPSPPPARPAPTSPQLGIRPAEGPAPGTPVLPGTRPGQDPASEDEGSRRRRPGSSLSRPTSPQPPREERP